MTRTASARILSLANHFANGQVAELGGELIDIGQGSAADQAEFAGEICSIEGPGSWMAAVKPGKAWRMRCRASWA